MNYFCFPNLSGCYKITSAIDLKVYVGSSKCIRKRAKEHFKLLAINKHSNPHLQNAYNKYGERNFKFEVITLCDANVRFDLEQKIINDYLSRKISIYNIHKSVSYNTDNRNIRPFFRIKRYGKDNAMFGKTKSKESRLATSEGLKKRWKDPEFRKIIMEKRKNNANYNKPMSKETCDRLHSQRIAKCIKVSATNILTGEYILAESGTKLSRIIGVSRKAIESRVNPDHKNFTNSIVKGCWIIQRADGIKYEKKANNKVMAININTKEVIYESSSAKLALAIGCSENQILTRINKSARDFTESLIKNEWRASKCPPA
jgi:group I intron endonuclease